MPFYLRTGKRLPSKLTQIAVTFREAPTQVFRSLDPGSIPSNMLLIMLQPSEGFSLCLPEAYETLLRDVMIDDQTLFVSADFTETAWRLYAPLLTGEKSGHFYTAGSWGPSEADALLEMNGHRWALGW